MLFLGFHIENSSLKLASLRKEQGIVILEQTMEIDLRKHPVKPFYMAPARFKDKETIIAGCIHADKTLIKEKEFPFSSKKALKSALAFQIEEMLPYPKSEAIISTYFIKDKATVLQMVAVHQRDFQQYLDEAKELGIEPEFTGSEIGALTYLAQFITDDSEKKAILFEGIDSLLFALTLNSRILFSYSAKLSQLDRLIAFIQSKALLDKDTSLHVFSENESFQKKMAEALNLPLSVYHEKERELAPYALAIGSALQAIHSPHNFQKGDFIADKILKKRKYLFLKTLVTLSACTLLLFSSNLFYENVQEKKVAEKLSSLLDSKVAKLPLDALYEKTAQARKEIKKESKSFSLLENPPKVGEILAWISSYPGLCERDPETGQGTELQSLSYELVDKNSAHVEMTLLFPSEEILAQFEKTFIKEESFKGKPLFKKEGLLCEVNFYIGNYANSH